MQVALRVEKSLVTAASNTQKEEIERTRKMENNEEDKKEQEGRRHMLATRVSPHEHLLLRQETE